MHEEQERPSPEELLKAVSREESEQNKARLKIFIGMAAGVGKTYSMLEEAQQLHKEGKDVYIGIIETHGREETAKLLEGLKNIPPKIVNYRGKDFRELDVDAIIALRPQLVLVDELAHSNVPGVRHSKRWEDVIEILDKGIDVYTTLNVQHIDSLNDMVESITGIAVKETVPDSVVEKANSIQLIDITPDELLQRLKEGKVYLGNQSQIAATHFFQKDRLTALREIVLRFAAEKVDHDLHGMVTTIEKQEVWRAREKLLVAVSSSPHSQKLIRTTRRLAFRLDAPWIAIYVNTGKILNEDESNLLERNLSLARKLGAEVITTNDPNIAEAIYRIARQRGVTQIVIGRPAKRKFFNFFQRSSLLEHLAIFCSDIDIHVIRQDKISGGYPKQFIFDFAQIKFLPYIVSTVWVLCLAGISWFSLPLIGYKIVGIIFLFGILSLSLFFKKGPIFFATILWALIWNFFFIPIPIQESGIVFSEDNALFVVYLLTAIVTGVLVDREREYKEMLVRREEGIQAFYDILRLIVSSPTIDEMLKGVQDRFEKVISGTFEIILKKMEGGLDLENSKIIRDEKEKNAAIWSFENEEEAGWSTSTLPMSKNLYVPMRGFHEVVGLIAYKPKVYRILSTDEKNFIYTVGGELAQYIERVFSEERTRRSEQLTQVEKVYHTVLKSISHQFQHPLSTIQDAIYEAFQALKFDQSVNKEKVIIPQIHKVKETSTKMQEIVDNINLMAKLTNGLMPVNIQPHSVNELMTQCLKEIQPFIKNRKVVTSIQEGLQPVSFDFELMLALVLNLLHNAIDYSPNDSKIEIEVTLANSFLVISISDEGPGIPLDLLNTIFNQTFRTPEVHASLMGLGLSISKRIAEIHEGFLVAENRIKAGAKLSLYIPIK